MVQKTPSTPRSAAKALARRTAILRAAAGVFRDRGVAATGMREIADAADLSLGNLYYYFRNKAELLYFCQVEALDRMLRSAAAWERGPQAAGDRLTRVITAHLEVTLNEVEGAAAHTELHELPPDLRRRIVARRDRYERAVRHIVADGVRRREFRRCDPALVTRAILGALNWTARWYRPGGTRPVAAIGQGFADYLVGGLRK